ncbi:MFS transporter [Ornithinibacillus gellani]|uniref:MFS transporter n=1 Tax=Ornithinibacillus gellani TaxID=2293253 RepID=UPI000F4A502A|nr:MFS transporter [Ornithinibacillus gellani]TQS74554.1 MFS transporter [Ornithinibacillus gellani]
MNKMVQSFMSRHEINRDLVILLVIGGLYSLGIFLSNTFVNIYLWRQAGDYMTIAMYNLAIFLFQPLSFYIAGKMAKRIERVIVLRMGVIFLSLFFIIVLLLGEQAATYNFMLGIVLGIGYGFYWLAYNVLTFEITEPETRDFFNGFLGILQSFGGMAGPIAAGYIITQLPEATGYTWIFSISFMLFIIAVVCSFFLRRRHAEGRFYFKRILDERHHNKNWQRILYAHFFQGLREGIFAFVITIWVYLITKSEFYLGVFNLAFSGMSLLVYFVAIKLITPTKRKIFILYGSLVLYASLFIILYRMNYQSLIIYAVIIGIAYPLINVPYASLTYDVIGKAWKAKEMRIEYIVIRELFINLGRVLSISVFIVSAIFLDIERVIPYLLILFGVGHLMIYPLIKNIYLQTTEEKELLVKEQLSDEKNR